MEPFVVLDDAPSDSVTVLSGLARVDRIDLDRLDAALADGWAAGLHCFAWLPYDLGEAAMGVADDAPGALYWFRDRHRTDRPPHVTGEAWLTGMAPTVSPEGFAADLARIHAAIAAGSTYQINHTFRMLGRAVGDPRSLYARLRERQAVAFGVLAHLPPPAAPWTLSLSPELFLAVDGDTATTRPMKGTAPADTDPAALRSGGKDRAENLMIVDLLRNDLSRVAVPGSVAVPSLFDVERVGNLWQMTSTVTARLTPATTPAGLLAATFPCGSITGAPKLASMRLIRDLEPDRRGIYTGSLGVIEPADTPLGWRMRLSVAIRTLEIDGDGAARLGIGCGVVADSTAGAEWLECLAKAGFATGVGPGVELLETMAVINGVCALGPRHSERLAHSAAALGIPAAPDAVTAAVAGTPPGAWRVSLRVGPDGVATVSRGPLPDTARPVRAVLAAAPWPRHPLAGHKTSDRAHLDAAVRRAAPGAFDVIGHDAASRVLEGARSNVFALIDGRWVTPPTRLGLLPGTMRAELLADPALIGAATIHEDEFTVAQLRGAERVVLTNALRGIMEARVEDGT